MPDKHAFLSASSSHRWINCPPSAALCAKKPNNSSPYAQQGTDAHSLCEHKVLTALGQASRDPTESLTWFDEEMEDCTDQYCTYVMNGKSVPALSVIKTPLRDGDMERPDDPAYANAYFVNANATSAPGIVDADRNPILTRSEVYSGVYGRASISFYAFNSSSNKGIACGLNNLQKILDGEPLGGKASAESDFASDEDDDFLD